MDLLRPGREVWTGRRTNPAARAAMLRRKGQHILNRVGVRRRGRRTGDRSPSRAPTTSRSIRSDPAQRPRERVGAVVFCTGWWSGGGGRDYDACGEPTATDVRARAEARSGVLTRRRVGAPLRSGVCRSRAAAFFGAGRTSRSGPRRGLWSAERDAPGRGTEGLESHRVFHWSMV